MKNHFTKISLFIITGILFFGCNSTKRVPNRKSLLVKNTIYVNDKKNHNEEVYYQLYQKENSTLLGFPLRLNIYNWAKPKTDSIFKSKFINNPKKYDLYSSLLSRKQVKRLGESFWYLGIHDFLRKTGEAPVILDTASTNKSSKRLKSYYFNKGYFDVSVSSKIDTISDKKVKLNYLVDAKKPYVIDTIKTTINNSTLDSIYQLKKQLSKIKSGKIFQTNDFNEERTRIAEEFRNNGAFRFQQNYINFNIDTLKNKHLANVNLIIENEPTNAEDSTKNDAFKLFKISKVNIFIDNVADNSKTIFKDSIFYNNTNIYSSQKLNYLPKALTDGLFITKDNFFSDQKTTLTSKYFSNLKVFNYPLIQYLEDQKEKGKLIANIYLIPRKKYTFNFLGDLLHSNIQEFGISGNTSLEIRNVFNGAETFEIGFRGNIGASKDLANPKNNFFNISEIGANSRLNFPRILLPLRTEKLIPKTMIPYTTISLGYSKQTNIGLDKLNFTSSFAYNWTPKKNTSFHFDLFNIQFVKNINVSNYFNIYNSSYESLNTLANTYETNTNYFYPNTNKLKIDFGTNGFLNDVLGTNPIIYPSEEDYKKIRSIYERRQRLTDNNLISASNISFYKTSQKDLTDNDYYTFRTTIESAGNFLSLLARISKQLENQNGANTFLDVEYSQYLKTEFEYIKHWDLNRKKVLATKAFFGIAIPYGNSNSIPFSRSYFGGGSNDNRAWQSYGLGPGKTKSINDFNEANMKLMFSTELRFNIFKQLYGATFVDAGNIWNVEDITTNKEALFTGLKSFENIAIGSGLGLRYDFTFFVLRFDLGFKTYNPANDENEKWFKEMRFDKSVLNIGINYPF